MLTDRAGFAGSTAVVTAAAVQACGSIAEAGVAAVCRKGSNSAVPVDPLGGPLSNIRLMKQDLV